VPGCGDAEVLALKPEFDLIFDEWLREQLADPYGAIVEQPESGFGSNALPATTKTWSAP
jgi:hypothetical protein